MYLEAVTVCVNYSDFLAHSLIHNRTLFDNLVVVTSKADQRTRDLCEHYYVKCISTDIFYEGQKAFDKGAGIREGLKHLSGKDWVVHLDADIVLPARTRGLLENMKLNPSMIYGVDRMMCPSYEAWTKYLSDPEIQHSCDIYVTGNAFPLGVRIAKLNADGYIPLGFFQLWNAATSKVMNYPSHGEADRSDLIFSQQWPRHERHLIPEIIAIHLETAGPKEMGANWRGRTTCHFGPPPTREHPCVPTKPVEYCD